MTFSVSCKLASGKVANMNGGELPSHELTDDTVAGNPVGCVRDDSTTLERNGRSNISRDQ